MNPKNKGKINYQSKFNTPIEESPFLKNFQALLLEKLIMIKAGTYSKKAMNQSISQIAHISRGKMNMDIDPIRITCDLEPELYYYIQETAKKVTGELMPMDELVRLLLTYFVRCYGTGRIEKKFQPFIRANPSGRLHLLNKFKIKMGRYFKNHMEKIPEQLDGATNFK